LCPERHADADFILMLRDQVRHHTIRTNGGDQRGEYAEKARDFGDQALASQTLKDRGFKRLKNKGDQRPRTTCAVTRLQELGS
jgi:hypothetical protein